LIKCVIKKPIFPKHFDMNLSKIATQNPLLLPSPYVSFKFTIKYSIFKPMEINSVKIHRFKLTIFSQFILIVQALLNEDIIHMIMEPSEMSKSIGETLFLCTTIWYMVNMYKMVKSFDTNIKVVNRVYTILVTAVLIGGVLASPGVHIIEDNIKRIILFFVQVSLYSSFCTIIYYTIIEIFGEKSNMEERMWGSACIYLMISISFASVYDIVCLVYPNATGVLHEMRFHSYMMCVAYSMNVLGALDSSFPDAMLIVKDVSIIEAVWSNLFSVLLVGRLLSK